MLSAAGGSATKCGYVYVLHVVDNDSSSSLFSSLSAAISSATSSNNPTSASLPQSTSSPHFSSANTANSALKWKKRWCVLSSVSSSASMTPAALSSSPIQNSSAVASAASNPNGSTAGLSMLNFFVDSKCDATDEKFYVHNIRIAVFSVDTFDRPFVFGVYFLFHPTSATANVTHSVNSNAGTISPSLLIAPSRHLIVVQATSEDERQEWLNALANYVKLPAAIPSAQFLSSCLSSSSHTSHSSASSSSVAPLPSSAFQLSALSSSSPLKEGYMIKLGDVVKNWKTRFFSLYSCHSVSSSSSLPTAILRYTRSQFDNKLLGEIPLNDASAVQSESSAFFGTTRPALSILVSGKQRKYVLTCETIIERDEWIEALKTAAGSRQTVQTQIEKTNDFSGSQPTSPTQTQKLINKLNSASTNDSSLLNDFSM